MSYAADLYHALPGRWSLERVISSDALLRGHAVFRPAGKDRLVYMEAGELTLNNLSYASYRSYVYEFRNDRILIFYNDPFRRGDIMHELDLHPSGEARHVHECGNDRYDLSCRFSKVTVTTTYKVTGPQKNYTIETVLSRFGF